MADPGNSEPVPVHRASIAERHCCIDVYASWRFVQVSNVKEVAVRKPELA